MKIPTLDQLGIPGIIGLGLLLFALSLHLGSVAPNQNELANLKLEEAQLLASSPPLKSGFDGAGFAIGTTVTEPILSITEFPELLKNLDALAEQHGVAIDRVSYDLNDRNGQRRLEINLPMKASYLALRAYLHDVLTMERAPALDELSMKRQQAGDPAVDAAFRFSYPVSSPEPSSVSAARGDSS